jgi:predicted DNA-binding antitoxin AbrB/MazE fold protein
MSENTAIIPVVYHDGVFVPQADVSHLAEGTSIDIAIPAPDEWDLLLEEITSEADDETAELTRSRWDNLDANTERWVIDSDDWLVWNLSEAREQSGILI